MKKLATLIALLTLSWSCFAQDGEIIYMEYNNNCKSMAKSLRTVNIDFDRDDTVDFRITGGFDYLPKILFIPSEGWHFREKADGVVYDTLVSTAPDGWIMDTCDYAYYYFPIPAIPSTHKLYGVRKVINDSTFLYGWFRFSWFNSSPNGGIGPPMLISFCANITTFCTTPNYPLRWDQTSITTIEENDINAFASIHPNPTAGLFTIEGNDLKRAEVFNTLGQLVAIEDNQGEQISIDIRSLPAGLYLVAVTDSENRKCVHKVVKN